MSVSGASGRSMHRGMSAFHAILEPAACSARLAPKVSFSRRRATHRSGKKQGNKIPPWRFHDLRRTMATGMARLKIPLPVIEKILAHSSGTFAGIVGVYQLHSFAAEKAEALEKWGNAVAKLVSGEIQKTGCRHVEQCFASRKRG